VAYVNTLHNPFFFDDDLTILKNPTIQSLFPLSVVLSPPAGGSPVQSRPFVNLSFALNYAIGGTNTFGYHLANLGIHLLAALTLMGIVRRTLAETEPCRPLADSAVGLSCAIATIWAVHPLDTEAITYVTQRTESLAGLLYLATLYGVIRGAHSERPVPWYVLAVAASALGMASKETMVTAPVVVMAFDGVFLSGSVRKAWRQRKSLYAGLALTWLVLVYDLASNGLARSTGAGFGGEMTVWQYAETQCWAILHYLRLAVIPHPLVLDYGEWTARSAADIVPGAVVVAVLLAGTAIALVRLPWLGFLGVWFFAILAPTSSVVPLPAQTVAEKRMYLPLAAVVTAVIVLSYLGWRWLTRSCCCARRLSSQADLLGTAGRCCGHRVLFGSLDPQPQSGLLKPRNHLARHSEGEASQPTRPVQPGHGIGPSGPDSGSVGVLPHRRDTQAVGRCREREPRRGPGTARQTGGGAALHACGGEPQTRG
jgi:hypothetical protein